MATWLLMIVGALVRAHGAGLACPDWPLCFGQVVPTFDMRVAFEWGHRAFVSVVSFGLVVGTVLVLRDPTTRRAVGWRVALAWALLIVQIVLGGLTVLLRLAFWTVTAHLLTATLFAGTLATIAHRLLRGSPSGVASGAVAAAGASSVLALTLQMGLGGLVSSTYAGLACMSFPTCDGEAWFPTSSSLVVLHLLHRWGALAVLGTQLWLAWAARPMGRLAWAGPALACLQIGLGIANVLLRLPVEVTGLHTAVAAALALHTVLVLERRGRP